MPDPRSRSQASKNAGEESMEIEANFFDAMESRGAVLDRDFFSDESLRSTQELLKGVRSTSKKGRKDKSGVAPQLGPKVYVPTVPQKDPVTKATDQLSSFMAEKETGGSEVSSEIGAALKALGDGLRSLSSKIDEQGVRTLSAQRSAVETATEVKVLGDQISNLSTLTETVRESYILQTSALAGQVASVEQRCSVLERLLRVLVSKGSLGEEKTQTARRAAKAAEIARSEDGGSTQTSSPPSVVQEDWELDDIPLADGVVSPSSISVTTDADNARVLATLVEKLAPYTAPAQSGVIVARSVVGNAPWLKKRPV